VKIFGKVNRKNPFFAAKKEAGVLAQLTHKAIVSFVAAIETPTHFCLVTQYAEGGDLCDFIIRNGRLHDREAWRIFGELVAAVQYMHSKGFVHRDIKPENIFLDQHQRVILGDLGFAHHWSVVERAIASETEEERLKSSAERRFSFDETIHMNLTKQEVEEHHKNARVARCGSLHYTAPEVWFEKKIGRNFYAGPEVDMFSLGAVLFVLLTGLMPFHASSTSGVIHNLNTGDYDLYRFLKKAKCSREAQDLIAKLLEPNPLKRATILDILQHPWMQKPS